MTTPPCTSPGTPLARVVAVVPAHDEADRLGRCLDALDRAVATARTAGLAARVVVVLDACTDGSAARVAARRGTFVVHGRWRRVGAARAAGCAAALRDAAAHGTGPAATWLACTDADSTVPFDWLTHHARLADRGADAVRGTVVVDDWTAWPAAVEAAHRAGHRADERHPHVHGANLGVRGSAYLAAGGFAPVASHEDVGLVAALHATGARVVATGCAAVRTSGRPAGRAPDGFSAHLRRLAHGASAGPLLGPSAGPSDPALAPADGA